VLRALWDGKGGRVSRRLCIRGKKGFTQIAAEKGADLRRFLIGGRFGGAVESGYRRFLGVPFLLE
jgi:hypothetical protein